MSKRKNGQLKYYMNNLPNFRNVLRETKEGIIRHCNDEYNCMSYALGIYNDWGDLPSFWSVADEYDIDTEEATESLEACLRACEDDLLDMFPFIRSISSPKDASSNERVIALRIGYDDFHFARLGDDGIWTHKPGRNVIRVMSEEEFHSEAWCKNARYFPYISRISYFAFDKEKEITYDYWR